MLYTRLSSSSIVPGFFMVAQIVSEQKSDTVGRGTVQENAIKPWMVQHADTARQAGEWWRSGMPWAAVLGRSREGAAEGIPQARKPTIQSGNLQPMGVSISSARM